MDSKLIKVSTLNMQPGSKEWLDFRLNGIGGSEISAVLGLNPYMSSHKLFYQKLQEADYDNENEAMHFGKRQEELIADEWQYHDPKSPDSETRIKNFNEGNIIRKCRKVNAYIINPEYPNLFASVDRIINKEGSNKEGVLECKTILGFASNIWIEGIPPMHLAQLQFYLLVCGLEYGELATLKDGRFFEVIPFKRNETFIELIKTSSIEFWDRVTRARILKQENKPYAQLEPEIDNQEAYKLFLTEKYKAEPKTIKPEMFYFDLGKKHIEINQKIDDLKAEQTTVDNQIKEYMKESDTMDFGASGKITWKENKASIKFDADKFKEDNPILYNKYTTEKPGARVLRISLK